MVGLSRHRRSPRPTLGIPNYRAIGPEVEPAIVYAIARQESSFNPRAISSARAIGLMQMTPAAGRSVANKFGAPYDEKRLLSDEARSPLTGGRAEGTTQLLPLKGRH